MVTHWWLKGKGGRQLARVSLGGWEQAGRWPVKPRIFIPSLSLTSAETYSSPGRLHVHTETG